MGTKRREGERNLSRDLETASSQHTGQGDTSQNKCPKAPPPYCEQGAADIFTPSTSAREYFGDDELFQLHPARPPIMAAAQGSIYWAAGKEGLVYTAQPGEGPGVDVVCPYEPCGLGQGLDVSVEGKCLNRV